MNRLNRAYPWALALWLALATATTFLALANALQNWQLTMG
jgi:hypothetical protein